LHRIFQLPGRQAASVWYELRWGITACLILTVLLITMIFYYHPSTKTAVSFFCTVPLLPEGSGRVEEIYVNSRDKVKAGQPIFKLDSSKQEAALETARRLIAEIDAAMEQATVELEAADGKIQEAQGAYQQAVEELETKHELQRRNASAVAQREIEKLENVVDSRQGTVSTAIANKKSIQTQISSLLPAQKASAEAVRAEAKVDLDKTVVHALIDGMIEQFTLRKGDIVNLSCAPQAS
jgi:multidrug resistance efflux pump